MGIRELFATSFRALGSHKLRSVLTLFGVVIGVMTVVTVVSVISGLNDFVATNLVNLNPDVLVFTRFGIIRSRAEFLMANRRKPLTTVDLQLVEANCRSCASVGATYASAWPWSMISSRTSGGHRARRAASN